MNAASRRPDRHDKLTEYRRALGRSGEVSIGAGARRARRRLVGRALLGVALLASAGGVYSVLRPADETRVAPTRVAFRCEACGVVTAVVANRPLIEQPRACSVCEADALTPEWACRNCQQRFVAPGADMGAVRCPTCGSTACGFAAAPHDVAASPPD